MGDSVSMSSGAAVEDGVIEDVDWAVSMSSGAAVEDGIIEDVDWANLAPDALVEIFTYLPIQYRFRIGSVCKSWRRESLNPVVWKSCTMSDVSDLSKRYDVNEQAVMDSILRSRSELISLAIESCPHSILGFIGNHCPQLLSLKLRRCSTNVTSTCRSPLQNAEALVHGCPLLRSIEFFLSDCCDLLFTTFAVTPFVNMLAINLPNLVSFVLEMEFRSVGDRDVEIIVDNMTRLEVLGLSRSGITDSSLGLIGSALLSLRSLTVDHCLWLTSEAVMTLRSNRKELYVSSKGVRGKDHCWYEADVVDDWDEQAHLFTG
ncbi:hypothetical protein CBR_g32573 [Chara braunii]|uniref:F-box domain-containing protein n=1 Tax=Chara braunii TaxID=69332 RepID=A0A388LH52_CHABU|nr:hypothetical protein CBR_g32573 [Chara braunii]|eukprot:GBG81581.1 hypothetical protein CBR_g32573 [Chara braunii]